jgi:hypothetical protein
VQGLWPGHQIMHGIHTHEGTSAKYPGSSVGRRGVRPRASLAPADRAGRVVCGVVSKSNPLAVLCDCACQSTVQRLLNAATASTGAGRTSATRPAQRLWPGLLVLQRHQLAQIANTKPWLFRPGPVAQVAFLAARLVRVCSSLPPHAQRGTSRPVPVLAHPPCRQHLGKTDRRLKMQNPKFPMDQLSSRSRKSQ